MLIIMILIQNSILFQSVWSIRQWTDYAQYRGHFETSLLDFIKRNTALIFLAPRIISPGTR